MLIPCGVFLVLGAKPPHEEPGPGDGGDGCGYEGSQEEAGHVMGAVVPDIDAVGKLRQEKEVHDNDNHFLLAVQALFLSDRSGIEHNFVASF
jgi:hypothetical protein